MSDSDHLPRVPSPSELAEAAVEVDHLIVPDVSLVRAVEPLVDGEGTIGTPETAVGADPVGHFERIREVMEAVDAPMRAVDRAVDRCVLSWRFYLDPAALAASDLEQQVATIIRDLDWPEARLGDASPLGGTVATVATEAFEPLQRQVLPRSATQLRGDERPSAAWRIGETTGALVDEACAVAEAGDTTVVAAGALRSHADAALGSVAASEAVPSSEGWDSFLELLRAAATPATVRVGDVRRVLRALDVDLEPVGDRLPIDQLGGESGVWLAAVTGTATGLSIGALREQFAFRTGIELGGGDDLVAGLDLADAEPTRGIVDDIVRSLELAASESNQVTDRVSPAETAWAIASRRGVFVDGGAWRRPVPPGLDDAWVARERHRLAHLVTSGDERIVLSTTEDSPLATWLRPTETTTVAPGPRTAQPVGFSPEKRPRKGHDRLTKTTLNRLLNSPRDALFVDVLQQPDRRALARGSAIHDYADLLVAAPSAIEAIGREPIRDWIAARLGPLVPHNRTELVDSRLEAAMAVVEAYLAGVHPHPDAIGAYHSPSWMDNTLAEAFDVAIDRNVTEQYFIDETLGVSGVIDLVRSPSHLVDFKTGTAPRLETVVRRGRVPLPTRRADVQLPLYLAALRRRQPDERLRMTFVYCHGSLGAALAGEPDLVALSRSIEYDPRPSTAAVPARDTIEALIDAVPADHPRGRLGETVPTDRLTAALDRLAAGDDEQGVITTLVAEAVDGGLDRPSAVAGARSLARATDRWRRRRLFRDDLDRFEAELAVWHDRRAVFDRDGYPLGDPVEAHLEFSELHTDLSPVTAVNR